MYFITTKVPQSHSQYTSCTSCKTIMTGLTAIAVGVLLTLVTPAVSVLDTEDSAFCTPDQDAAQNSTIVCPPWSVCDTTSHKCRCSTAHLSYVKCGARTTRIQFCHCLTYSSEYREYSLGDCFYNCGQGNPSDRTEAYLEIPSNPTEINEAMCGNLDRDGTLCGQCRKNSSVLVYSYNVSCIECPRGQNNWWKFILAAFGPLTVLYLIVLLCKVEITPVYMYTFVFYAQAMSTPIFLRSIIIALGKEHNNIMTGVKVVSSMYGIWSLDFFRAFYNDICLDVGSIQSQALEYTIALYPLLLIVTSYLIVKLNLIQCCCIRYVCKPFIFMLHAFDRTWDTTSSLIDAYAMFFILSLTKIFYVTFDLLLPTKIYTLDSNSMLSHQWVLYFDGSKRYFGKDHLPFAILAITIFGIFIVLPGLVLCLFPFGFFQRFLNSLNCDVTPLRLFVDKFQGFFKNGRDPGTRDCRLFSLFHIVLMFLMFTAYGSTLNITYYSLGAAVMIISACIYALVQPYKSAYSHYNKINIAFFILLALQYIMASASDVSSVKEHRFTWRYYATAFALSLLPLIYFAVVVTCRLSTRMKCRSGILNFRFKAPRMDYEDDSHEHSLLYERPDTLHKFVN